MLDLCPLGMQCNSNSALTTNHHHQPTLSHVFNLICFDTYTYTHHLRYFTSLWFHTINRTCLYPSIYFPYFPTPPIRNNGLFSGLTPSLITKTVSTLQKQDDYFELLLNILENRGVKVLFVSNFALFFVCFSKKCKKV